MLELVARSYAAGWLLLSELYEEQGSLEKAKDACRRYIERQPGDFRGWKRLVELSRRTDSPAR